MFNINEKTIVHLASKISATKIENSNYNEIIASIQKVIIGRLRELTNDEELPNEFTQFADITSLQQRADTLIGSIIERNGLDTMTLDFSSFSNKEFRYLVDFILSELNNEIERYTINYSREFLLIEVLTFASILSNLTMAVYNESEELFRQNDAIKNTAFWLRLLHTYHLDDIRGTIGEMKGAIECAVDAILLNQTTFSENITKKPMDYFQLLTLFNAKNTLYQVRDIIPLLGKDRKDFALDPERGIILPTNILDAFATYTATTKTEKIRVENELTDHLFNTFNESLGFQPKDIINYVTKDESERAFRIFDHFLSIADKELLSLDMMYNQHLSKESVDHLVNAFILNDKKYYKHQDERNNRHHMGSANSRLYRAPIIQLETKILVPTYTWLESLNYLSLRILNRDIFSEMVTNTWNELIKQSYDEYDLPALQRHLEDKQITAHINVDLANIQEIKEDIESIKQMPHEVDLLFVNQQSLIVIDLKNYGIQHNFVDVRKVVNKINKQKAKMNKLKQFIMERKPIFERMFQEEFNDVSVSILTVNPTIYPYLQKDDSQVDVLSIQDFKKRFK